MKDASIVVVKPELIETKGIVCTQESGPVANSLIERGYKIESFGFRENWRIFAIEMYRRVLNEEQMTSYLRGYQENKWPNEYSFFVVSHNQGSSIARVKKDQGKFDTYQTRDEDTLRAKFGLPKKFNRRVKDMTLVYSGIHAPSNKTELLEHIRFLGLEKIFDI